MNRNHINLFYFRESCDMFPGPDLLHDRILVTRSYIHGSLEQMTANGIELR